MEPQQPGVSDTATTGCTGVDGASAVGVVQEQGAANPPVQKRVGNLSSVGPWEDER